ncbi:unnamed protein product [marine sediment metagenome]|uniref:Uncharacterized protein n=1 Tax=marine sediment metagenome TaxID=412755 RepID=X1FBY0_9ZZZZ
MDACVTEEQEHLVAGVLLEINVQLRLIAGALDKILDKLGA